MAAKQTTPVPIVPGSRDLQTYLTVAHVSFCHVPTIKIKVLGKLRPFEHWSRVCMSISSMRRIMPTTKKGGTLNNESKMTYFRVQSCRMEY